MKGPFTIGDVLVSKVLPKTHLLFESEIRWVDFNTHRRSAYKLRVTPPYNEVYYVSSLEKHYEFDLNDQMKWEFNSLICDEASYKAQQKLEEFKYKIPKGTQVWFREAEPPNFGKMEIVRGEVMHHYLPRFPQFHPIVIEVLTQENRIYFKSITDVARSQ